jgi:hypothetical protein
VVIGDAFGAHHFECAKVVSGSAKLFVIHRCALRGATTGLRAAPTRVSICQRGSRPPRPRSRWTLGGRR